MGTMIINTEESKAELQTKEKVMQARMLELKKFYPGTYESMYEYQQLLKNIQTVQAKLYKS